MHHYVNRDILADIYNRKVWKIFSSNNIPFFMPELADSNLGIMINID